MSLNDKTEVRGQAIALLADRVRRTSATVNTCFSAAAMLMLVGIWVLMTAEVLTRYVFGISLLVTWEFSSYFLSWIIFLACPAAAQKAVHVRVTMAEDALPDRLKQVLRCVAYGIGLFAISYLFIAFFKFTVENYERGVVSQTVLKFPIWVLYAVGTLSMAAVVLTVISKILDEIQPQERG